MKHENLIDAIAIVVLLAINALILHVIYDAGIALIRQVEGTCH